MTLIKYFLGNFRYLNS